MSSPTDDLTVVRAQQAGVAFLTSLAASTFLQQQQQQQQQHLVAAAATTAAAAAAAAATAAAAAATAATAMATMTQSVGSFWFENEYNDVVDLDKCTFRLWKGGNHGDGTKVTGPGATSALFICIKVPQSAAFELTIERRAQIPKGKKSAERAVLIKRAAGQTASTLHPVLETRARGQQYDKLTMTNDAADSTTLIRLKICEEFCKAGAKNMWTYQIRGGGFLRFHVSGISNFPIMSSDVPYSYQTCSVPECGKEARRGSSWCKLHEDEALANDSAMVPPTFEGVYSALALIDDIKNDYLSPEWTGSVPEMLDDNAMWTPSPLSGVSNPYAVSPDAMHDPLLMLLQQEQQMQQFTGAALSPPAPVPVAGTSAMATAAAASPGGDASADFDKFFRDLLLDFSSFDGVGTALSPGSNANTPASSSTADPVSPAPFPSPGMLAQDMLLMALSRTPVMLRLNDAQQAELAPRLQAALGSQLVVAQIKFQRSLLGEPLHFESLDGSSAWAFCSHAADFLNATLRPHGLVPPFIEPQHIHAWAANGCWQMSMAVKLPGTGDAQRDAARQAAVRAALSALTQRDVQYAFPHWEVKSGPHNGLHLPLQAVRAESDEPAAKVARLSQDQLAAGLQEVAASLSQKATQSTPPHIVMASQPPRHVRSTAVDPRGARSRVMAFLRFLRAQHGEDAQVLITQLMAKTMDQAAFLAAAARLVGEPLPAQFGVDLAAAMGSMMQPSEVVGALRVRQELLERALRELTGEEELARCQQALDTVHRTIQSMQLQLNARILAQQGTAGEPRIPQQLADINVIPSATLEVESAAVAAALAKSDVPVSEEVLLAGGLLQRLCPPPSNPLRSLGFTERPLVQLLRASDQGLQALAVAEVVPELPIEAAAAPERLNVVWTHLPSPAGFCPIPVVVRLYLGDGQVAFENARAVLPFSFALVAAPGASPCSIGLSIDTPCGLHRRETRLLSHPSSWTNAVLCTFLRQLTWAQPHLTDLAAAVPQVAAAPEICYPAFVHITDFASAADWAASPCATSAFGAGIEISTVDDVLTRIGLQPHSETIFNAVHRSLDSTQTVGIMPH